MACPRKLNLLKLPPSAASAARSKMQSNCQIRYHLQAVSAARSKTQGKKLKEGNTCKVHPQQQKKVPPSTSAVSAARFNAKHAKRKKNEFLNGPDGIVFALNAS